jgi:16S rRNA (guanine1207-N2)-methyltransferase
VDDPVDELIAAEAPHSARHIWVLGRPRLIPAARPWAPTSFWSDDIRELGPVRHNHGDEIIANPMDGDAGPVPDQVWMELPESLDALDNTLSALHGLAAARGATNLHIVAGGRIRRMNKSLNTVAARWFDDVHASLGRRRARVLHFSSPRVHPASGAGWPRHNQISTMGLKVELVAHGGVFHGAGLDAGTALLLDQRGTMLSRLPSRPAILDLGCGNGVIAAALALELQGAAEVQARDVSWLAVDSTRRTALANHVDVDVTQADGLDGVADESLDLIVTNPPFHRGSARDSAPTRRMLTDAARVLRPGGQLWCVYNSHLPWGEHLDAEVGPTQQVARTKAYTVTRTIRD